MLDQLVRFVDDVEAESVEITVSKSQDAIFLKAPRTPGVIFKISDLRSSNGGILNDTTALRVLNTQLRGG